MNILLTGFTPFDDVLNPSEVLIRSLEADLPAALAPHRSQLHFAVLPTQTDRAWPTLLAHLEALAPDVCLFSGQARGRPCITLERMATNLMDYHCPDAAGDLIRDRVVVADGPAAYWSSLPDQAGLIAAMTAAGVPAGFSNHAGNHLCNQILYRSLHHAALRSLATTSAFVHLPLLPEQASGAWADAPSLSLAVLRTAFTVMLTSLLEETTAT